MKTPQILLILCSLALAFNVSAKTVCSMTFNSVDEKQLFSKHLSPIGYEQVELVPDSKDPNWFKKACASDVSCDILVVSGHFGGLFFGESASTISLAELISAKEKSLCPNILDKPKSVFLMGCNTLASKSPDHRSVNDYLYILVGDGFPLNLAEEVAASRYLDFGQSMSEFMTSIFNKSQMVVGFDSTGPLGAQAAPRLERAFKETSLADKNTTGISKTAILTAFKGTNLRVVTPTIKKADLDRTEALSGNNPAALLAWKNILANQNISKHYDFIIKNKTNPQLKKVLSEDLVLGKSVYTKMLKIYQSATGLSSIQVNVIEFLKYHNLVDHYIYQDALIYIGSNLLVRELDYISADQLCTLLREHRDLDLLSKFTDAQNNKIEYSSYGNYLRKCSGIIPQKTTYSKSYHCLMNETTYDWACLTENQPDLDIDSCALAKSRNPDIENGDNMMWYCYSKMIDQGRLNKASCLELTHHFSILGNQLKMNWNCMNRLSY
ncbi:hypothetical protein SHI21_02805 [Bacteriovorax sp. PP10]|uniref:Caspase family p20 domain-containing protein n=1 Tax=Bacteriovorax antarcticus TaxID=3088717 RepID=A0ABU5VRW9_9BACT|nr:hypothetical protein [Bacteriovorax sp. PP10]MEA9355109.1 hypothetical protein [Bacteriovorax sp. PP10]